MRLPGELQFVPTVMTGGTSDFTDLRSGPFTDIRSGFGHIEQRVAALEAKVAKMEAWLKAMNTPAAPPPPPCFNDD